MLRRILQLLIMHEVHHRLPNRKLDFYKTTKLTLVRIKIIACQLLNGKCELRTKTMNIKFEFNYLTLKNSTIQINSPFFQKETNFEQRKYFSTYFACTNQHFLKQYHPIVDHYPYFPKSRSRIVKQSIIAESI